MVQEDATEQERKGNNVVPMHVEKAYVDRELLSSKERASSYKTENHSCPNSNTSSIGIQTGRSKKGLISQG